VYSLVKTLEEQLARELVRWHPDLSITALRFSNVMVPEDYAEFPSFDADARLRKWNLWGYIDARDGAQAVERALQVAKPGFDRFIIAAADTVMSRPNAELIAEVFPGVPVTREIEPNETLLSIDRARRVLGFEPEVEFERGLELYVTWLRNRYPDARVLLEGEVDRNWHAPATHG
jgi:UDP-glucose 4-epimerase